MLSRASACGRGGVPDRSCGSTVFYGELEGGRSNGAPANRTLLREVLGTTYSLTVSSSHTSCLPEARVVPGRSSGGASEEVTPR